MAEYDYLRGAANTLGVHFETQMIVYIAAASCNRTDLKDFWIARNADGVIGWDDIILYTETLQGDKNLQFIQLKHKEDAGRISISSPEFKKEIAKYAKGFEDISSLMCNIKCTENQHKIKDILEGTEIPFDKIEFILMTNAAYVDNATSKNPGHNTLGPVSKKPSNIMTNQNGSVNSISSNMSAKNPLNSNFTKQVFIVSEQAGVKKDELLNVITNELKQFISSTNFKYHFEVTKHLVANIKNWFPEKKRIICKDNIKQIISNGVLNTLNHTKTIPNVSIKLNTKEWDIFEKLIEPFQLVLVSKVDLILKNYFDTNASRYFITCDEINVDFIINYLNISKDIKIILFLKKNSIESINEKNFSISTLKSMSTISENLLAPLSEYCITFQDRATKFKKLIKSNPSLKSIFTVDDVISLLANRLNIGDKICETPEYYVSRTIPRIFVNKSIIFKIVTSHFIIIVNDDSEYATLTAHSFWNTKSSDMRSIKETENNETMESNYSIVNRDSFSEILANVKSKFNAVHTLKYCKYKNDFVLEWVSTTGNINELENFIEKEQFEIKAIGDNLTDMHWNYRNGAVISANPGMGKTYFTKHLANIFSVDSIFWTVFISLNELNFEAVNNFQAYLMDYRNKLNSKDKEIFNSYLENKSVIILFDGFDEIAPKNVEEALRIIKEGYEDGLKIVVTSREVTRKLLEKNLNLLSYTLEPFTKGNKLQFLETYFLDNIRKPDNFDANAFEDKIKQFSMKLFDSCSLSNWDEDFTGIPLQCKLLAEGFKDECEHYCQTGEERIITNKINLITLYENFIEKKFNICIEEKEKIVAKGKVKNKLINSLKNEFLENHINAAVQVIFPQFGIKISEEFAEEIKNGEDRFGLITKIDENNNPVFLHRTFAEYFAAKCLVNIKERRTEVDESKREEYLKLLLEPQYNVVQDLFDRLICIDCELHIAVLNRDTTNVKEILEKNGGSDEGKCGRTALHLLAARGAQHERGDGRIERKGEEKYAETLKVLLENSVCCSEEDELLHWTQQEYSNYRNAFGVIDLLLGNQRNQLYNLENAFIEKWDKDEIMQMFLKYDYGNVGMKFVDLKELELDTTEALLERCVENDSVRFAERLIHCKELNSDVLSKMTFEYEGRYENRTLLHIAAQKGNVKILTLLLQYIDVDIKDKDGRTALSVACRKERLSSVKALLERNAQLFLQDKDRFTPMDWAVRSGNKELAKYVTQYEFLKTGFGDDVNAALPSYWKGSTALHFAANGNNLSTIERLIFEGADVNITDDYKRTALHLFCQSEEKEFNCNIVRRFIESGENIDAPEIVGETPLHLAASWGNKRGVELLLKLGADPNILDKKQRTALSVARERKKDGIFLLLWEKTEVRNVQDVGYKCVFTKEDDLEVRRATFVGFPTNLLGIVDSLSQAGFIYYGIRDNVICFQCGLVLLNWEPTDDPWFDHAKYEPKCEFLIREKGLEFIQSCQAGETSKVNAQNNEGQTELHWAASWGNKGAVESLLELGANPNIVDNKQRTALNIAREEKKDEVFLILFEKTKVISERDALHKSVLTNGENLELRRATFVGFPQQLSGIVDLVSKSGFYYFGIKDCVRCFHCGLDLDDWEPTDDPWFEHAEYEPECEFLIQEKGLEYIQSCQLMLNQLNREKQIEEEVNRLIDSATKTSNGNINAKNNESQTALHLAAWLGNTEMVNSLLELGANPNIVDNEQRTALSVAREEMKDEAFLILFEKTEIKSERDVLHKSVLTKGDDEELRRATFVGFPQQLSGIVDLLSKSGFYFYGIKDCARCFHCGLDLDDWEPTDDPWFEHATREPECDFLIREKGPEFIESCTRNWNRWEHRLNNEKPITEEVNRLIESAMKLGDMTDVNIIAQNNDRQTALHLAAWLGSTEMVKSLLDLGANPNILDNEQRTPLSVAREETKDDVFLILFELTEVISERDALHKSVLTNGNHEDVRRATFVGFPKELPGIDLISQAGFYYFGIEDYVRCFRCGQVLLAWEPSHNPWFQHAKFEPNCEFLIQEKGLEYIQSCQQKPIGSKLEETSEYIDVQHSDGDTALHQASCWELGANANEVNNDQRTALSVARINKDNETFLKLWDKTKVKSEHDIRFYIRIDGPNVDVDLRKRTFVRFPQELSGLVNSMAESGLYYVGVKDYLKCFRCGAWIRSWSTSDDPWIRHAIVKPSCTFLIEQKGEEFVKSFNS